MRRNSDAWPRSQSLLAAWAVLMWATNSSVTLARATSVMSSLVLADEAEQQVEGPGEDVEVDLERRGRTARDDTAGVRLLRRRPARHRGEREVVGIAGR